MALIGSLGMLFYFKYANFVLRSVNALLGTAFAELQGIGTLPLGIIAYSLQLYFDFSGYSLMGIGMGDVYKRQLGYCARYCCTTARLLA